MAACCSLRLKPLWDPVCRHEIWMLGQQNSKRRKNKGLRKMKRFQSAFSAVQNSPVSFHEISLWHELIKRLQTDANLQLSVASCSDKC